MASIASQYGVPAATIARYNHLGPSDRPQIGQKLALTSPVRLPVASDAPQADKITTSAIPPRIPEPKAAAVPTPVEPRKVVTAAPLAAAPAPEPGTQATTRAEELDFRWPVRGRVIAKFGPQPSGGNVDGIKIAVPQGTPVHAAEAGVVAYAGSELKPYGNLVLVRHANGWVTAYAHNSNIDVKSGDQIKRGQIIARAGQTGNVSQPQVHFEIRKGKTPVDPMEHLSGS
ncbi:MAG: peptidoglycan DD-metalloendopeptidase family protein [Hyphomicrobiales bacterium]|nr:peptidoglycan DD-metalloendopeptidase family protein [Hyphomicrobiales bacterium]